MDTTHYHASSPMIKDEDYVDSDMEMDMDMTPFSAESTPVVDPQALLATSNQSDAISPADLSSPAPHGSSGSSEEKKTKKRKSWGQVLPEPKTNLPPRFVLTPAFAVS